MPDYRTMFDSDWTRAWDLGGEERVVMIVKVVAGVLEDPRRKKRDKKPILTLKGWPKPLALNKTNSRTIAAMYGNKTEAWIGKRIALYTDRTRDPQTGSDVDCIRIRPTAPTTPGVPAPAVEAPPPEEAREPGGEG